MKVTLYKSTDGLIHETHKACAKREIELRVLPAVAALAEETAKEPGDGGVFSTNERGEPCLYVDDVPKWVASNAAALRKILNDALIAKRPRKAKAPKRVPGDAFPAGSLTGATVQ